MSRDRFMILVGNHLGCYPYVLSTEDVRKTVRWFATTQLKVNKQHLIEAAVKVSQAIYSERRKEWRENTERLRRINKNLDNVEGRK